MDSDKPYLENYRPRLNVKDGVIGTYKLMPHVAQKKIVRPSLFSVTALHESYLKSG